MEGGPARPRSPYVSSNGSTGSGISSNLFEIDVDAALREFADNRSSPHAMGSCPPSDNATESAHMSGRQGSNVAGDLGAVSRDGDGVLDLEQPTEQALSGESSDSDVIHIDLTQRLPPLPMSGLALEDIVSMLPGSTYTVSGSGIPMRAPPRSEPVHQSPSAEAGTKSPSADSGSARPDTSADAEGPGDPGSGPGRDRPLGTASQPSGGGAAASGGGSPRMALTFIPGLGLVPVLIHEDATDEDEDEMDDGDDDVDMCGIEFHVGGAGMGGVMGDGSHGGDNETGPIVSFLESDNDDDDDDGVAAVAAAFSANYDNDNDSHEGADDDAAIGIPGNLSFPRFAPAAVDSPARTDVDESNSPGAGRGATPDAGDSAQRGDASTRKVNVSEEQLRDIIQQAVHGLEFGEVMYDEGALDEDDEDEDAVQSQPLRDSPEVLAMDRVAPASAAAFPALGHATPATDAPARELLNAFEGSAQRPAAPLQLHKPTPAMGGGAAEPNDGAGSNTAAAPDQETDDDKDDDDDDDEGADLDNTDATDTMEIADEVDDSGSGGGDEAESILGGLGQPRISLTSSGPPMMTVAPVPTSAMEVAGAHTADAFDPGAATPDSSQAAATGGNNDAHFMGFGQRPSSAASVHLPRPRYLPHNVVRLYDLPRGARPDDSSTAPQDGPEQGACAAGGMEAGDGPRLARPAPASGTYKVVASSYSGSGSSSLPTPFAGSVLGTSGNGSDLNSTLRTTGQSLSAIRQAALQAEARQQAKVMAERLGGGADMGPQAATSAGAVDGLRPHPPPHPADPSSKPGGPHTANPFGFAGLQASAAAGLTDVSVNHDSSTHHRVGRRAGSSSSGYGHVDGRHRQGPQGGVDEAHGDLVDLLRDRSIIQPRYPTDAKDDHGHHHAHHRHHHQHHHGRHGEEPSEHFASADRAAESAGNAASGVDPADDGESKRPRHRRSVELVDLGMLAGKDAGPDQPSSSSPKPAQNSSSDGNSPRSPPARSLLATRKSDEGQLPPIFASSSPRMRDGEDGSPASSSGSSSAHSVADERLVDELEALREELGQKTTLVAGLRGELRKYTGLTMRLEHQLGELRSQAGEGGARARIRSQSDTGTHGGLGIGAPAAEQQERGQPDGPQGLPQGVMSPAGGLPQTHLMHPTSSTPVQSAAVPHDAAGHTLPPHPQSQGLEAPARLALYRDILDKAQLEVGRSCGPAPPDLRDAHELIQRRDTLDAGTEKVMLFKLQKILMWGCEAAWKASVAQQQTRFLEQAAQQEAQARSALETEREQLKQALELARASRLPPLGAAARGWPALGTAITPTEEELRRKLETSEAEAKAARAEISDLESVVASLNADVRKLRSQLRSSRDGTSSSEAAADAATSSMAWSMERQMLLKTISALEQDLAQVRDVASVGTTDAANAGAAASGADSDEATKKAALATAALERMEQLQAERDAALSENADLRRRLDEALAAADAEDSQAPSGAGSGSHRWRLEQLQAELAAAREALELQATSAETEAALHEQQCAVLRAQVVELRQEHALNAADAAVAACRHADDLHALEVARAAAAGKEALIEELRQQLMATEMETEEMGAVLSDQANATGTPLERPRPGRKLDLDMADAGRGVSEQDRRSWSMERRVAALRLDLEQQSMDAAATVEELQQALKSDSDERERLQQLLEAKTLELEQAGAQVDEVHAAVSELHDEAAELQSQVADLQALLARVQGERDDAETGAAEAGAQAAAADERASDAHAASLLAESALERALEEVEALRRRAASLEDDAEQAREGALLWQRRCEEAEAALLTARTDAEELRGYAVGLEDEARELRTALSAEDNLQVQLRGQVECLESELEAQASLAQMSGERAAEVEAALAEERHCNAGRVTPEEAEADAAEAGEARAEAAQRRVVELEAHITGLHLQLTDALQRCETAARQEADMERRMVAAVGQRERAEQRLLDMVVQLESMQRDIDELQRREQDEALEEEGRLAATARLAALEEQLQAADLDREALRMEVAGLLRQLGAAVQKSAAQPAQEQRQQQDALLAADQMAALRADKARLLADCATLEAELDRLRGVDVSLKDAVARADALQHQVNTARSEVQAVRSELQAAAVELSVKGELLAAKDRSLQTLQETVDALKMALQVTQQKPQGQAPSLKRTAVDVAATDTDREGTGDAHMQQYRGTVAALQNKFADSEYTIRRLEKQVAALETRLRTDDGPTASSPAGSGMAFDVRLSPRAQQQPYGSDSAVRELRMQLQEKDAENAQLLRELELTRNQASASARIAAASGANSSSPRGFGTTSANEAGSIAAATVNDLQMQILQWRALGEDVHARYQSKKEAVRRLREQLAAEQQRHADEHSGGQAQLEAACQRLGRFATELGAALRRCIALDLQPLSATAMTTSPRSLMGGAAAPDDVNALAALVARQGAALIESLEMALDQVTTAREERSLVTAQLAHRQAVLDELRHHLARQAGVTPVDGAAMTGGLSGGGGGLVTASNITSAGVWASQAPFPTGAYAPPRAAEMRQVLSNSALHTGSAHLGAAGSPVPSLTQPSQADTGTSPRAAPMSSPSKGLKTAAMNLAQDMATLSAQQAGLRNTLHHFEQRNAQQSRQRSLGSATYAPGAYQSASALAYPLGSSLRTAARGGTNVAAPDGLSFAPSSPGAEPHSFVGLLSGGRAEALAPAAVATSSAGTQSLRLAYGLYSQPTSNVAAAVGSAQDRLRVPDALRDTIGVAPPLSPTRMQFSHFGTGMSLGTSATAPSTPSGAAGVPASPMGASSGLVLSRERRLKLAEPGL